ncbi:MFS general substrate transporter [Durotheca rogersii]|uniref:MFS general substrate transporter n=1 Tax=Durotheca rogersii TaxID=419775 RepID=UPI0022203FD7|nr:MFS general substrate transporter [Durotheca rogersii]KAI5857327.1 MFS general substrate transporter [Durotheca rogersii]
MGLGILEPHTDEPVPGTVHLQAEAGRRLRNRSRLKHGTGRHADIVLAPQPSDSPNDPLNWSRARKLYTSIFLSIGTGLMAGTHNFVNPANSQLAKTFQTNISTISQSVSIVLLTLGISAVFSSPLARIWGKRPVILVGNALATIGYVIAVSKPGNLTALYVGRAIHGLGISPLEYLVSSSVGDLFFVHERGVHLALWHYALSGGNAIGQVIGTQILAAQGWLWPFYYTIIAFALYTIIYLFTCPETTYNRPHWLDIDIEEEVAENSSLEGGGSGDKSDNNRVASQKSSNPVTTEVRDFEGGGSSDAPISYWQGLKIYNRRFSDESPVRSLLTPWTAFMLPAVSWAGFSYGCSVAFSASFSVALGQIFTKPPYNLTTSQVGLSAFSSFIAATLGNAIPGPVCDWLVKFLSRKNKGVYEPEFRLILSVPSLILGLMGFWGFGLSLEGKSDFMVPVFFYGLSVFAGSINSLISNAYLLDCHRPQAQDGYAAVTITRGVYSFAMTFVINGWLSRDGYKVVYFWIGFLHGLSCIIGIALYFFGKKASPLAGAEGLVRYAVAKNKFIQSRIATRKII